MLARPILGLSHGCILANALMSMWNKSGLVCFGIPMQFKPYVSLLLQSNAESSSAALA